MLIRKPPVAPVALSEAGSPAQPPSSESSFSLGQALRSPQFLVLGFTFFACCAAHSGPIFHMISYATLCGITPMAAVSIYSVEGLAGLGGRLLFGVASDRLGVKPVLVTGLMVQAIAIGAYLAVSQLGEFYTLAVIFGAAYGGVMPLYAVLAREYFGQENMGAVFGAATMLSSIGMAFGPVAGGWLFDAFDGYTWLFIGSSIVALAAVAIAFTFPPFPRQEQLRAV
jgi:MFS family permease